MYNIKDVMLSSPMRTTYLLRKLTLNLKDEAVEFEQMAKDTGLRNDALIAAWLKRPIAASKLYSGSADTIKHFCMRIHADVNESREKRGDDPLPGDGWSEWDIGAEYVPGPIRGELINSYGQTKAAR